MDDIPFNEIKDKLNFSAIPKPALIGIVAVLVVVAVLAGRLLIGTATANEFVLEPEAENSQSAERENDTEDEAPSPKTIFVHVSGAVKQPGLITLEEGKRVGDAIEATGGFSEDGDPSSVNLARPLTDGEQIIVGALNGNPENQNTITGDNSENGISQKGTATKNSSGKVNINSASAEELTALPGVGEATAAKIVADRKENGPFKSPEDITRVSGIGQKKYESMAEMIII